jgi:hypothetical protein
MHFGHFGGGGPRSQSGCRFGRGSSGAIEGGYGGVTAARATAGVVEGGAGGIGGIGRLL